MSLSFIEPLFLWALLLLPLLWLFAWAGRAPNLVRLGRGRYAALIALRSIIVAALVLALAGAQLVQPVNDTAVVFLIDGSDSLAPAQRERAVAYMNQAMDAAETTDQAAVVVFGADAAVERAPGQPATLRGLSSAVAGSRTDIADAIQLGLALLPAEAQKRLVLLSDGAENEGRAVEAARLAALRGVPIEVVPLPAERGPDVLVTALDAPRTAREGQELPLAVRLESGVAGPARVEILADGQLVAASDLQLAVGGETLEVRVPAGEAGFRRLEARVIAPADTQPLNNSAAAFTQVDGPPRVLLVARDASRAAPLRAAMEAAQIRVSVVAPAQTPASPADLQQLAAVFLVDVPAADLSPETQRALVEYVRVQGGGLAMIGGVDSFGAGGWRRTPLAEVLPVELDPPAREERPDLALALVIDRSGSMAESAGPGRTKLDLARDAVYLATQGLSQRDRIGVFVFDDSAQELLPIQPLPDAFTIEETLSQVSVGAGTNIRAGVERAAPALAAVDARVKHMILLTDGLDDTNYAGLVENLRDQGTTVTIVSIGGDANPELEAVAQQGGGAFYRVTEAREVPEIFLRETVRVAARDIVEGPFTPLIAIPAPPVRGLGGLPPLLGYNATSPREAARTLLVAPDGSPLLAVWQVGLGRALAWTSDFKGQWAADWLSWTNFPRLAAGLVDSLRPPVTSERLALETRVEGARAVLDLLVSGADGRPGEAGLIEGRLLGPEGEALNLAFVEQAPGRYRAVADAATPGVYLAQVVAQDAAGQPLGATSGGLVVSYSPEYGVPATSATLLGDLAGVTGGRVEPPPAALFAPAGQSVGRVREVSLPLLWLALALLPLDIALRRLFLRLQELLPAFARRPRLATAAAPATDPAMARLQAARERSRAQRVTPRSSTPAPKASDTAAAAAAPPPSSPPAPPAQQAEPSPAPAADDPLASLLANKNRRRRP